MPIRETPLINNHYYHVYNRGVAKQNIFWDQHHYTHFEKTLGYYLTQSPIISFSRFLDNSQANQLQFSYLHSTKPKLAEIVTYCLMPNHFHLLLKQVSAQGISNYLRLVCNSYTRYLNKISNRVGPIFQGRFKAVLVKTNEYLLHLSRYIHINPSTAGIVTYQDLLDYPYSSYPQYINPTLPQLVPINNKIILKQFSNPGVYEQFCLDQAAYQHSLTSISSLCFDL